MLVMCYCGLVGVLLFDYGGCEVLFVCCVCCVFVVFILCLHAGV